MYDARTLKQSIRVTNETVECPVEGCGRTVTRQRQTFRRHDDFKCHEHGIYISATTFEYVEPDRNLLAIDAADLSLFARLAGAKAESGRLGRERSEDAVTFNVVRALEREGMLDAMLTSVGGREVTGAVASYWSLLSDSGATHQLLGDARRAFRENPNYGTEPDLLIETDDTLFVVEAKLGSTNEKPPSRTSVLPRYQSAADGWYATVFQSNPEMVAVVDKLYQLMRCWLLGSWMAERAGKRLVLVNLVAESSDISVPARFAAHIRETEYRSFKRLTWETVREFVRRRTLDGSSVRLGVLVEYLDHKTLGYDAARRLQLALATGIPT